MLLSLAIRDIVLVESLALEFGPDLTVLTGETGAGKSILLDALGLALGARADAGLVRRGTGRGSVAAAFRLDPSHPARDLLAEHALATEEGSLLLRRVVDAGGGSRAFINDQPVSVGLLRQIGDLLVEMHGQHDDRGLLDATGHRRLLDAFGGHERERREVAEAHARWRRARAALAEATAAQDSARADEDYLRHAVEELRSMDPQPGEEQALSDERTRMMLAEKIAGGIAEIHDELCAEDGADARLRGAVRRLERLGAQAGDLLAPVIAAFDRAAAEAAEGLDALARLRNSLDVDAARAEAVEERLFALRALARKHRCAPDDLPALAETLARRLDAIDHGEEKLAELAGAESRAREDFEAAVAALRTVRETAAERLAEAVNAELPPLRLDKARFRARIEPLDPGDWTAEGGERVVFEVATNPGAPFGPLVRIASGGELARFILALKVSLAATTPAATLVFDEVDRGVGGATADAVGVRLARLAEHAQVLVVTHSPQVAARGGQHFRIDKVAQDGGGPVSVATSVALLDAPGRREEIARMLSGARITDEARAAADRLIERTA